MQILFRLCGERLSNPVDSRGTFPQCWVGKTNLTWHFDDILAIPVVQSVKPPWRLAVELLDPVILDSIPERSCSF